MAGGVGIMLFTVQHNFEDAYATSTDKWDLDQGAMSGTSFLVLPGWMNWFTANIGYHHVHHLSAAIPNYRLVACHSANQGLFDGSAAHPAVPGSRFPQVPAVVSRNPAHHSPEQGRHLDSLNQRTCRCAFLMGRQADSPGNSAANPIASVARIGMADPLETGVVMKRLCVIAIATLASAQALAVGNLADVSSPTVTPARLSLVHRHRGEYWVAGRPGARYAINIRNQQGARLLAVTSVDGVNILTGESAAFDQRGYVFDPWVGYDIAGWRKSDSQIAAFTFTSVPRSYAARTGRPDNVGVIGVALFRERPPVPVAMNERSDLASARAEAPAADAAGALSRDREEKSQAARTQSWYRSRATRGLPGRHVGFDREQQQPNEIIRIRYDSRDNLVAMGVIRQAVPVPSRPQPFPGEGGWATCRIRKPLSASAILSRMDASATPATYTDEALMSRYAAGDVAGVRPAVPAA